LTYNQNNSLDASASGTKRHTSNGGWNTSNRGCIVKHWVAEERGGGKQTEQGMRGIFIGFDVNTKGYLFYMPGSRNIMVSADATFSMKPFTVP
jgi:hypothetical protein